MGARALSHVEFRENLPALARKALHEREEVHFGNRGRDELALIASDSLAELKRLAQLAVAHGLTTEVQVPNDPWAGLKGALRAGRLPAGSAPLSRRLPEHFDAEREEEGVTRVSWDEMARRGNASPRTSEFTRHLASRSR